MISMVIFKQNSLESQLKDMLLILSGGIWVSSSSTLLAVSLSAPATANITTRQATSYILMPQPHVLHVIWNMI